MDENKGIYDYWRGPTLLLWIVFFGTGLVPEWFFTQLRLLGGVVTQNALVNSPYFITVAWSGYYAVFCFQRCREAGLGERASRGNAVQHGMIALLAFLPYPLILLFSASQMAGNAGARHLLYAVGAAKLLGWWYLLWKTFSYYVFGNPGVFVQTVLLFPSTRSTYRREKARLRNQQGATETTEAETKTNS